MYDGAATVIDDESQIAGPIKLGRGRPKGSADIHERGPRPCALCRQYETIPASEKSNIWTCKGRMGGKNGGRKACQYFECNGQRKRTTNMIGS